MKKGMEIIKYEILQYSSFHLEYVWIIKTFTLNNTLTCDMFLLKCLFQYFSGNKLFNQNKKRKRHEARFLLTLKLNSEKVGKGWFQNFPINLKYYTPSFRVICK